MAEGRRRCADELIGMLDELIGLDGDRAVDDKPNQSHDKQRLATELRPNMHASHNSGPKQPPLFNASAESGSPERKPVLHNIHRQEDAKQLLEKIKQRNREKQARHRARVKKELQELEEKVDLMQSKVQQARMHQRRLKCKAHALKTRCQEATDTLAAEEKAAAADLAEPPAEHHPTTSAAHLPSLQLETLHTSRQKHHAQQSSIPQPIESYKHCESVAYAEIAPCMLPLHDCTGPGFNLIQRALEDYQRGVSNRKLLRPQEICWFIQFPYAIVPDFNLSYSAGLNSPECALSISLCYSVASAECLFLSLELEAHEAAKTPGATPPVHAFVKECEALLEAGQKGWGAQDILAQSAALSVPAAVLELIQTPPDPDPVILAKLYARAGIHKQFPMEAAVQETLGAVLREHRAQLPRELWQAVCMKCMLVAAASIERMQSAMLSSQKSADKSATDGATDEASCKRASSAARGSEAADGGCKPGKSGPEEGQACTGECLHWGLLRQAMLATIQLRLRTYHHVLYEIVPTVHSAPQKSEADINGRVYEIMATVGISTMTAFQANPASARTILLQQHFGHFQDFTKMEREQMRVISFLGIPQEQKPLLAAKWHHWRSRRIALDKTLATAFHTLNRALPSPATLPSELLAALERYAPQNDDDEGNGGDAVLAGARTGNGFIGGVLERHNSDHSEFKSGEPCDGAKPDKQEVKSDEQEAVVAPSGAQWGWVASVGPTEERLKDGEAKGEDLFCEISTFVSKPCVAVNPCDHHSVLSAAEATFGGDRGLITCTATSQPPSAGPLGEKGSITNRTQKKKRPHSQDSASSVRNVAAPPNVACNACAAGSTGGGSGGPSSSSMHGQTAVHSQAALQNTSTSGVSGRTNVALRSQLLRSLGARQPSHNNEGPVTSDSASGDPKATCKNVNVTARTAPPHVCAASHVQVATGDEQAEADTTDQDEPPKMRQDTAEQACTDQLPLTDVSATGRRPSSILSRHSSHDAIDSVPNAQPAAQRGWWKRRNRRVFLAEDMERLEAVEEALEVVASVHETDSLMYHEMMLPAWELTPMQHARLFAAHVELGSAKLDMLRLFRSAAHDIRCAELFSGF